MKRQLAALSTLVFLVACGNVQPLAETGTETPSPGNTVINPDTSNVNEDPGAVAPLNPTVPTGPTTPTEPVTPTGPEAPQVSFEIRSTAGGPVPWGVAYFVKASGEIPAGSTLSAVCDGHAAVDIQAAYDTYQGYFRSGSNSVSTILSCIRSDAAQDVTFNLLDDKGEVVASETVRSNVAAAEGIPFAGTWNLGQDDYADVRFTVDTQTGEGAASGEGEWLEHDYETPPVPATVALQLNNDSTLSVHLETADGFNRDMTMVFVPQGEESRQLFIAQETIEGGEILWLGRQ